MAETDMCATDAVQFLTGCTYAKGNVIHRDWGKNAYTFFRRSDGKAIRVVARPGAWQRDTECQALFTKVREGTATDDERRRFRELHLEQSHVVPGLDPDALYETVEVYEEPPVQSRVHASVVCAGCGEGTMETRIRRLGGHDLCPPCFEAALSRP